MQEQQPRRLLSPLAIAGLFTLLIATGSGAAWWTWKNSAAPTPNAVEQAQPQDPSGSNLATDPSKSQKLPATTAPVTAEKTLQVYWLKTSGDRIQLAPSPVKLTSNNTPEALLETAIKQLIAGPTQADLASTVPANTRLLNLTVKQDGVHVDLSREFTAGGGSSSMEGRLAQVLYTATSLNPDAPLWLSVEGKPLETLGGEGLVVEQPVTRKQFERDFPL
ncbi:MAG: GerMN domain-containing protein [Leptolyngbyaceae cyanobacterium bins.302]|nr:GerMN domain-containing protein [Leptolyngbyaceae cyanobacterium bins.302]